VFVILIIIFQTVFLSLFLIILYKKLNKIIYNNDNLRKIFNDRMDELNLTVNNISTLISKIDSFSTDTHLNKSISDKYLLLKKTDSTTLGNNDKIQIDSLDHLATSMESSFDFESPSPGPLGTKIHTPIDLDNDRDVSNKQKYENKSVDELKTIEDEILTALERLEKTTSSNISSDEVKEKDEKNQTK
jgi:hypothetical protein